MPKIITSKKEWITKENKCKLWKNYDASKGAILWLAKKHASGESIIEQ